MNKVLALMAVLLTFGVSALAETPKETYDRWMQAVSPEYGYQIAYELSTNPAYVNSERFGGRQAGSDAEHAAAEYLYQEMLSLGLEDVEKVAADCDRWQFNGASFTVDGEDYPVYTYATAATPADGLTAEIVYVGQGTMWDYEGLDVTGKIVLVDINQRDDHLSDAGGAAPGRGGDSGGERRRLRAGGGRRAEQPGYLRPDEHPNLLHRRSRKP